MPKLLSNIKDTILSTAKKQLLEEGYVSLNIRDIAQKCSVATGTLYNYFKSKEILVATILFEDWKKIILITHKECDSSKSLQDGISIIYHNICKFTGVYGKVWSEYGMGDHSIHSVTKRRGFLVDQIQREIEYVIKIHNVTVSKEMLPVAAEILLEQIMHQKYDYNVIEESVMRLLK